MNRKEILDKEILMNFMLKEMDIIHDIIKRMAYNSFLIKGWAVTLVTVALLLKGAEKYQVLVAFIPLVAFWYLDAYFLRQERMYRKLYDWIIRNRLKTDEYLFDMDARRFDSQVQSIVETMFSITLRWFYGSIGILTLIYAIILITIGGGD
jgi:hypothetical protein